jgi:hypothetical protein
VRTGDLRPRKAALAGFSTGNTGTTGPVRTGDLRPRESQLYPGSAPVIPVPPGRSAPVTSGPSRVVQYPSQMAKRKQSTDAKTPGCVLPSKPSDGSLRETLLGRSERDEANIIEYVEWQLSKGRDTPVAVQHAEIVKAERVFGRDHKVWDAYTTDGRWWVITNPTNLYSQVEFPSLDYTLSFHIGLTARLAHRDHRKPATPNSDRFAGAWRRWQQASRAIDEAHEAEDFQAVGMKCRECLLTFARGAQSDIETPPVAERPKRGDFTGWAELIADWAAPGEQSKDIRRYLKQLAASTWQLVNWLTHARNAIFVDAELVVSATEHLLSSFADAIVRRESGRPDRCPKCSSYQLDSYYAPELDRDPSYMLVCRECEWEAPATPAQDNPA